MNNTFYFDLTEALSSISGGKGGYYGIARTVHELGKEVAIAKPETCFVVYSFGLKKFYAVDYVLTDDGQPAFKLPKEANQQWSRSSFGGNYLLEGVFSLFAKRNNEKNRKLWEKHASHLSPVEIDDGVFFSAARPKLIVDMVKSLKQKQSETKVATLLHDFMPLHDGATKRFRRIDKNFLYDNIFLIQNAKHILTNSKFTARELEEFARKGILPTPTATVSIVPLVHECPEGDESSEINLPEGEYLLTVGANLGRKNIEVIFEALQGMDRHGKRIPKLVIAGSLKRRLLSYANLPRFSRIRDKLIFVESPNQTDLCKLYRGAAAVVVPSKLEGWGLPAGEALWCGTPVISSTADALREVCGDLALYFDPDDDTRLSHLVEKLMNDECFYNNLRMKICDAKPNLRTWSDVASDTLQALAYSDHR